MRAASKDKWLRRTGSALDPLLHRLRAAPAETLLRLLPQGREKRLEPAAEGATPGAPRGPLRRAPRKGVADPAHEVDEIPFDPGRARHSRGSLRRREEKFTYNGLGEGVTFLSPALERKPRSQGARSEAPRLLFHRDADLFLVLPRVRRTCARSRSWARSTPKSHRPGWLRALAPQARPKLSKEYGRITLHDASSR